MTTPDVVRVERADRVATVTMDRGPLNVLDAAALDALARAFASDEVRGAHAVVLRGAGRAFCAGLDVADHLRPSFRPMLDAFRRALRAAWDVPVPTVASAAGACLGGGLEILAVADLAIAARGARFGAPEIRLGVFPPLGAAGYATLLGPRRAAEVLYVGGTFGADEALAMGLVNRVVADETLDAETASLASSVAHSSRDALVRLKAAIRRADPGPWAALAAAEDEYDRLMALPGAEEGLRAFLEKRRPATKEA